MAQTNVTQYAVNQHNVNQNNVNQTNVNNQMELTSGLYVYGNVLHMLYYDERHILPVGIMVEVPGFHDHFIYFIENYNHTNTRSITNYVYYGRNNDEVNERRTQLLNYTNTAKNLLADIRNTYRH